MAQKNVLCDTGVLINVLRKDKSTIEKLDTIGRDHVFISIVTVAEIYNGTRKKEREDTINLLSSINVLHLDKEISKKFKSLSNFLFKKDNTIPVEDLLIASTAIEYGFELLTLNKKDFMQLPGIKLYKP
jgi:predicted nucleic acid-binding protein